LFDFGENDIDYKLFIVLCLILQLLVFNFGKNVIDSKYSVVLLYLVSWCLFMCEILFLYKFLQLQ